VRNTESYKSVRL